MHGSEVNGIRRYGNRKPDIPLRWNSERKHSHLLLRLLWTRLAGGFIPMTRRNQDARSAVDRLPTLSVLDDAYTASEDDGEITVVPLGIILCPCHAASIRQSRICSDHLHI